MCQVCHQYALSSVCYYRTNKCFIDKLVINGMVARGMSTDILSLLIRARIKNMRDIVIFCLPNGRVGPEDKQKPSILSKFVDEGNINSNQDEGKFRRSGPILKQ